MKILEKVDPRKFDQDTVFLHHTGNMFGIGCSAFSKKAIKRISCYKKRTNNNYIVLIPKISWLENFSVEISPAIKRLMQQFWPGNLSIIIRTKDERFQHLQKNGKIAFRIPTSKFLRNFLNRIKTPIISTSINQTGETALTDIEKIEKLEWFDLAFLPRKIPEISAERSTIIGDFFLVREGSISFAKLEKAYRKPQILFVCTGNICRSPMAEYYLKNRLKKKNITVKSAGFLKSNVPISENSRKVLQENGIDASAHFSKQLNKYLVQESWLILTMTHLHKKKLLQIFPSVENQVFTLLEYAKRHGDIEDPYMQDIDQYRIAFDIISKAIDDILKIKLQEVL